MCYEDEELDVVLPKEIEERLAKREEDYLCRTKPYDTAYAALSACISGAIGFALLYGRCAEEWLGECVADGQGSFGMGILGFLAAAALTARPVYRSLRAWRARKAFFG